MSAGTQIAELVIRFAGEDSSFRQANAAIQRGLQKSALVAEESADAMFHLAQSAKNEALDIYSQETGVT